MTTTDDTRTGEEHLSEDPTLTSEGAQGLAPRDVTAAAERMRELGAVLRMAESDVSAAGAESRWPTTSTPPRWTRP